MIGMNEEIIRAAGLGKFVDLVKEGKCPFCKEKVDLKDFKDELSRKDYESNGMCQKCQDKFYEEL